MCGLRPGGLVSEPRVACEPGNVRDCGSGWNAMASKQPIVRSVPLTVCRLKAAQALVIRQIERSDRVFAELAVQAIIHLDAVPAVRRHNAQQIFKHAGIMQSVL